MEKNEGGKKDKGEYYNGFDGFHGFFRLLLSFFLNFSMFFSLVQVSSCFFFYFFSVPFLLFTFFPTLSPFNRLGNYLSPDFLLQRRLVLEIQIHENSFWEIHGKVS